MHKPWAKSAHPGGCHLPSHTLRKGASCPWHMPQSFGQPCTSCATPHAGVGGIQEEMLGRVPHEEGLLENPSTCSTKATQVAPRGLSRPQLVLSHPLLEPSRTSGSANSAIAHVPPCAPTVAKERRRLAGLLPPYGQMVRPRQPGGPRPEIGQCVGLSMVTIGRQQPVSQHSTKDAS